jgi:hypothetical protein
MTAGEIVGYLSGITLTTRLRAVTHFNLCVPGFARRQRYFELSLSRPRRARLSAVATIASSLDRGFQPKTRCAF